MGFAGEQPERWLVRLLVTRDPTDEATPDLWKWDVLLEGGDPAVMSAEMVGWETTESESCSDESSSSESS